MPQPATTACNGCSAVLAHTVLLAPIDRAELSALNVVKAVDSNHDVLLWVLLLKKMAAVAAVGWPQAQLMCSPGCLRYVGSGRSTWICSNAELSLYHGDCYPRYTCACAIACQSRYSNPCQGHKPRLKYSSLNPAETKKLLYFTYLTREGTLSLILVCQRRGEQQTDNATILHAVAIYPARHRRGWSH